MKNNHFWLKRLKDIRQNWLIGNVVVVCLIGGMGIIGALLTPRGPITTVQAIVWMVLAGLIGFGVGLVTKSRWSVVLSPMFFILTFELTRIGVDGPTVGLIQLGSTYGIIAFIVGRFVPGLIVILPLMLGVVFGGWFGARYFSNSPLSPGLASVSFTSLGTLGVIALAVIIAFPAGTSPILGSDGKRLPGSVAELETVRIGGHDQVLMIRGRSKDNPVLLYLAGGPGGTDLGAMRADTGLEQHFVVATWDQRGTGKSYSALDPAKSLTLDNMVADTLEVTNYLRNRFNEEKVYLVGNSWGTILGTLAVKERPDLFHAYVGAGQMVSPVATDKMFYEDTLEWAKNTGRDGLVSRLENNGTPPYENILSYEPAISYEHQWNSNPGRDPSTELPSNLFVSENSFMDKINGMRGFLDVFSILYPRIQEVDFRDDVLSLEVPVYMVIGKYEARGRKIPAKEWFEILSAPVKELVEFDNSGHRPNFEEPAKFASFMVQVADTTYGVA
ncbi:alpha/beta fold hydrolase [Candidatus Bipolaricaulota bacterium]|nr:alpha/beta fold hydrolase [Candidatus Bipolaricaulota bacterium]MBS3792856.1 alpha/beta fold hydrolase [Candidatus Bipolaricaulota bacterium]